MKPFYITTSIAYPNAKLHIGYALELIQADFLARYYRLQGSEVEFLTGLDEHGLKMYRVAAAAGKEPQVFLDEQLPVFSGLADSLNVSYDRYIRTTDPDHLEMAQALWKMCADRGDIYKKQYQAWYDVKEEEFLGMVADHPDPSVFGRKPEFIEKIDEENYFFALSRYQNEVLALLQTGQLAIVPESRGVELVNFITRTGLQDVSISREAKALPWGVEVPGDPDQVMYVWYDALTNYLTHTCTIDSRGIIAPGPAWPADIHVVGKDIHRFHGVLWPAMLLSAGLPLPKSLLVHGFINAAGQKMSKSLGNVIYAEPLIEQYGVDALRWFLLSEIATTGDYDYQPERFAEVYSAVLANDFGNLVSRVWTMCQRYTEGCVPRVAAETVANAEAAVLDEAWQHYHSSIDRRDIQAGLKVAHGLVGFCNRRIEELKPWVMAKDEGRRAELEEFLYELLEMIRGVSLMVLPTMPATAAVVLERTLRQAAPFSYTTNQVWGGLTPGAALGDEQPLLFPRVARD